MTRIGILTFHASCNFGANLQTLATQQTIRRLGAEPIVIDYQDEPKNEVYRRTIDPAQYQKHLQFCEQHLELSPTVTTNDQIKEYCCDELDAVVVGSDAVFRTAATADPRRLWKRLRGKSNSLKFTRSDQLSPYFLPWASGDAKLKRFSIAASCTATPFHWLGLGRLKDLSNCFTRFEDLFVRDKWTDKMIRYSTRGKVKGSLCPDPVFALRRGLDERHETWTQSDLSKTILLSAISDNDWTRRFRDAVQTLGFQIGNLPNPETDFANDHLDLTIPLPLSPLEWFSIIDQCAGFVGMRFHALVSCLTNHTPIVTMDLGSRFHPTYSAGSKYRDLCSRANLMDRYSTRQTLLKMNPSDVATKLFDRRTQDTANDFADTSADYFEATIQSILDQI